MLGEWYMSSLAGVNDVQSARKQLVAIWDHQLFPSSLSCSMGVPSSSRQSCASMSTSAMDPFTWNQCRRTWPSSVQ